MRAYLYLLVFGVGAGALAIELAAARLLDPWFGNSQIVWAALISLVLACLALGAWIGGRVGDRSPSLLPLLAVVMVSGVATAVIPVMAQPVLQLAIRDLLELETGLLLAAMLAVAILLTFPLVLLGAVTPWVVRIALSSVNTGGRTAGSLYAVGTVGSILGTLAPVLWLVPSYGTRRTFLLIGLWLVLLALCGSPWVARRQHATGLAGVLAMAALLGFDVLSGSAGIRPGPVAGSVPSRLLHEEESRYNYIAVREAGGERWLKLNEGNGIHSVWHPDRILSRGIWDYFLLAPWFSANPPDPATARVLVIGLAAGTVSSLWTDVYGPAPITGV
ncbi:MAG: fused MFS/spermidine synthase, partial [Caldilineaceae bacterium]|nr:fused MFS/spermidine synthase [Caldilineaceae bacterium]